MRLKFHFLLAPLLLLSLVGCKSKEPTAPNTTFRISIEQDPLSLDPRLVRDLQTSTIMHMLYEGLMRCEKDGQHTCAIAEEATASPDQQTYTFKLKPALWSNGDPLTANDFEQTWKSLLDPSFPCPNANFLYVIKGAKEAKEGKGSLDNVGVRAVDDSTLVVNLVQPTPYFLNILTMHVFYPVHESMRQASAESESLPDAKIFTNGPFKIGKWSRNNELIADRNPLYWDHNNVSLDKIQLVILDNNTALQLYNNGSLDWTGSPLSTLSVDALPTIKKQGQLEVVPAAGIYMFRINTGKPPFHRPKMRKAFAYALNRKDLVDRVLLGNQEPALGLIPTSFLQGKPYFKDADIDTARQLFREALAEQRLTWQNFPQITIHYGTSERSHKIAQVAQQQWKANLGIDVNMQSTEAKTYYDKLKNHDYQIGIGSWYADIHDPIAFLDIFKYKNNGTNNTQWEHSKFVELLEQSAKPDQFSHRKELLKEAEALIMNDMPVIPLFFSTYNYVKNPKIQGVFFSELGYLDFKKAYWE